MTITVVYSSVDRFRKKRTFKTLAGARKFAQEWVGQNPDMGSSYAVSADGVGKIEAWGCKLADLFGDATFKIYTVEPGADKYHTTRADAEAELKALQEYDPGTARGIQEHTVTKEDFT